jgi:hypothetical protein
MTSWRFANLSWQVGVVSWQLKCPGTGRQEANVNANQV